MADKVQLNVRVAPDTRRLLEMAAACESRSLGAVLDDAVHLYIKSHSGTLRDYFEAAREFCEAADGSERKAVARSVLLAGVRREEGLSEPQRGGDLDSVRVRIRQHRGHEQTTRHDREP